MIAKCCKEDEKRRKLRLKYTLTENGETETGVRARRSVGGRHVAPLFLSSSLFPFAFSHCLLLSVATNVSLPILLHARCA